MATACRDHHLCAVVGEAASRCPRATAELIPGIYDCEQALNVSFLSFLGAAATSVASALSGRRVQGRLHTELTRISLASVVASQFCFYAVQI